MINQVSIRKKIIQRKHRIYTITLNGGDRNDEEKEQILTARTHSFAYASQTVKDTTKLFSKKLQ